MCGVALRKMRKVLCEDTQVAIGNGLNTLFWEHKWATKIPLASLVVQPISIDYHEQQWLICGRRG